MLRVSFCALPEPTPIWPSAADCTVVITPAQLGYLLEGIDWRMPQKNLASEFGGMSKTAGMAGANYGSIAP